MPLFALLSVALELLFRSTHFKCNYNVDVQHVCRGWCDVLQLCWVAVFVFVEVGHFGRGNKSLVSFENEEMFVYQLTCLLVGAIILPSWYHFVSNVQLQFSQLYMYYV